ncbi:MAG TPA: adenosylcobinamide-GDP ribazoletransferase [Dehalococcoidia bacterium]
MNPLLALEFLTVVRLWPARDVDVRDVARSQAFFPAVGLLLGLALLGADRLLDGVLPFLLLNAVLVVGLAALTGGLHLDGLADTADGVLGGRTPSARLAIMRDSRVGSYGALALASLLLLKWAALASLLPPLRAGALLVVPALARWHVVVAVAAAPYARPGGRWEAFHREAWPVPLLAAGGTALAASVLAFGAGGTVLFGLGALAALGLTLWLKSLLGGLTGDTYGAVLEVTETLLFMVVAGAHGGRWLEPWLVR